MPAVVFIKIGKRKILNVKFFNERKFLIFENFIKNMQKRNIFLEKELK